MAHTPLFAAVARLIRISNYSRRSGIPAGELLDGLASFQRRRFLQAASAATAVAVAGSLSGCKVAERRPDGEIIPRIAIIGAGMSGLHCAWRLHKQGVHAEIYEAADRTGGRIFTKADLLNQGQTVELGGEFIDSKHTDMRDLAKEFKLELLDMNDDADVRECAYFFGGSHYTDREVLDALKPFVARMARDARWIEADWEKLHSDRVVRELDQTSIEAYLQQIGVSGWLKDLLEVAFVTEFGLDAGEQSSFNLLDLIGLDVEAARWEPFGESDERFKVKGGNQLVADELAKRLEGRIHTGRRLARVQQVAGKYELAFDKGGDVDADIVVLTLPFTVLRDVELDLDMSTEKRHAIAELGYGTNAKVMAGMSSRSWRKHGFAGAAFTDEPFQLAWDNARGQPGDGAGITLYSGGKAGLAVGEGSPRSQVERLLPGYEKVFAGAAQAFNGNVFRMDWPRHAFTKASYACYKPGQWTTIAGHEIEPVGNALFAGEHCSEDFQGYMNGAAETGRLAAEEILARVRD